MTVDRRTAEMDAHHFWRQFVVAFYFDKPGDTIAGTIIQPLRADGPPADLVPSIRVQTKDGRVFEVTAHQERLKAELVKAAPVPGDLVKIVYTGEAAKAAPGMNKAKLFTVDVRRPGSQTPGRTEVRGSASENDPGSGETSS